MLPVFLLVILILDFAVCNVYLTPQHYAITNGNRGNNLTFTCKDNTSGIIVEWQFISGYLTYRHFDRNFGNVTTSKYSIKRFPSPNYSTLTLFNISSENVGIVRCNVLLRRPGEPHPTLESMIYEVYNKTITTNTIGTIHYINASLTLDDYYGIFRFKWYIYENSVISEVTTTTIYDNPLRLVRAKTYGRIVTDATRRTFSVHCYHINPFFKRIYDIGITINDNNIYVSSEPVIDDNIDNKVIAYRNLN